MPGPISESHEEPICRCGHYKQIHTTRGIVRPCEVDGCDCQDFEQVDLDETALGQALNEWLSRPPGEVSPGKTIPSGSKLMGGLNE